MRKHPKQSPETLLDLATDNHPIGNNGMSLAEALAQVDRLNNGDKALKRIIRDAYRPQKQKKQ